MLWRIVPLEFIGHGPSIPFVLLTAGMTLTHPAAGPTSLEGPRQIEVFTAAPDERSGWIQQLREHPSDIRRIVYRLDGIHQLEQSLSQGLSRDSKTAKAAVLSRLSPLDPSLLNTVRQTAVGLIKLIEYRIDRYPAIVFDGQAVVYGVTRLDEGLRYYRQWQDRTMP